MKNCKSLSEFAQLLNKIEGPIRSKSGGKKFLVDGKEKSIQQLVQKHLSLAKHAELNTENALASHAIIDKLEKLDNDQPFVQERPHKQKSPSPLQQLERGMVRMQFGPELKRRDLVLQTMELLVAPALQRLLQEARELALLLPKSKDPKIKRKLILKQKLIDHIGNQIEALNHLGDMEEVISNSKQFQKIIKDIEKSLAV